MAIDISRERVQKLVAEGAQLVDVRGDVEYGEEHIAGAICLPLNVLDAVTADRALDRSRPVIVY